jgi:hypothetical protein
VLAVLLPGLRDAAPKVLMGVGWLFSIAALGCALAAWQGVSAWSAAARDSAAVHPDGGGAGELPRHPAAAAAPWLLLGSVGLVAASLLAAL